MTVETNPVFPSSGDTAKIGMRSMMVPDLNRVPSQRLVFPEPDPRSPEPPRVRWPRVFPSL